MNIMHELDIEETRARLRHWSDWCDTIITMGLNYSRHTVIARLVAEHGNLINGTAQSLIPNNALADEMDDLINAYADIAPRKAQVLCLHYTARHLPITMRIKKSQLSRSTYFAYVSTAEQWIAKHLEQ